MSRMNSGILNFDSVTPSTEVAIPAPDFVEGRMVGGQTQVGAPRQQVGPSSGEAGYAALAQIAGGVAKGLDTFADIGSRIEKSKIQKAQLLFDEIDGKEDLDGDTKFSQFEEGIKDIYTPLLGDSWRKDMDNRVRKQWLSGAARDTFEQNRYNRELGEFLQTKNLQSPAQLTDNLLDEFQQTYEAKYPLAKEVTWFQATRFQTQAGVAKKAAETSTAIFKARLNEHFAPIPQEILQQWSTTQNPEEKKRIADAYPGFSSFLERIDTLSDTTSIFNYFNEEMKNMAKESLKGMPEDLQADVLANMGEVATKVMGEALRLKFQHNSNTRIAQASVSVEAAMTNFKTDGNTVTLLDTILEVAPDLSPQVRQSMVPAIFEELYNKAKKDDPTGTPYKWKTTANELYENWANPKGLLAFGRKGGKGNLLESRLLLPGQKMETVRQTAWEALEQGNGTVAIDIKTQAQQTIDNNENKSGWFKFQLPEIRQRDLATAREETAQTLGIEVSSLMKFFVDTGNASVSSQSVKDWYNNLSSDEKKRLRDAGYDLEKNYGNLRGVLESQNKAEKEFLVASINDQNKAESASGKAKTQDEFRSEILQGQHIDTLNLSLTAAKKDPAFDEKLRELSPEEQALIQEGRGLQLKFDVALGQMVSYYDNLINNTEDSDPKKQFYYAMREKYKGMLDDGVLFYPNDTNQSLSSFLQTPGLVLTEPQSDNPVFSSRLTLEGFKRLQQLKFRWTQIASDPNNPDNQKEITELYKTMVSVASQGIRGIEDNPGIMYALTAAIGGLRASGNDIDFATLLGVDDSRVMLMLGLMDASLDLSTQSFTPDPEDAASRETFTRISQETMTAFMAAGQASGAIDVPSMFINNKAEKPAEVVGTLRGWSRGEVDSNVADTNLQAILKTLGMSESEFYQTIALSSGNNALPAFDDTSNPMVWEIKTTGGPEYKTWEDMTFADKIQVALANTRNATILPKLPGWLAAAGNAAGKQGVVFGKPFLLASYLSEDRSSQNRLNYLGEPVPLEQEYMLAAAGRSPPGVLFRGDEIVKTEAVYKAPQGSPSRTQLNQIARNMLGVSGTIRTTKESVNENILSSEGEPYELKAQNEEEVIGMAFIYGMDQIPGLPQQIAKAVGFEISKDILDDPEANTETRKGVTKAQALGTGDPPLLNNQQEKLVGALLQHLGPELRKGKPRLTVVLRNGQPTWSLQIGSRTFATGQADLDKAIELFGKKTDPYIDGTDDLKTRKNRISKNLRKVNQLADPEIRALAERRQQALKEAEAMGIDLENPKKKDQKPNQEKEADQNDTTQF